MDRKWRLSWTAAVAGGLGALSACNGDAQRERSTRDASSGTAGSAGLADSGMPRRGSGASGVSQPGATEESGVPGGSAGLLRGSGGSGTSQPDSEAPGSCAVGFADCDHNPGNGCETNTETDWRNCGQCGLLCPSSGLGYACRGGQCMTGVCSAGFADCDGNEANDCETNTATSVDNCGECDQPCSTPHAVPTCADAFCKVLRCDPGFSDCNGASGDGCETRTASCAEFCGAPSIQPPFAGSCASGCPTGTVCVYERGGIAGGGGEYCATVPPACNGAPSCSCMANCVCTNTLGGRPESCDETSGPNDGSIAIACDDGVR